MILSIGAAEPGLGAWDRERGGGRKVSSNKKNLGKTNGEFNFHQTSNIHPEISPILLNLLVLQSFYNHCNK